MRIQDVISSRPAIGMGMIMARYLPRRAGYALAGAAATLLTRISPQIYQVVRANLQQVLGTSADDETLSRATYHVFRYAACTYYDLFHILKQGPQAIASTVHIPPPARSHLTEALAQGKGIILATAHLSNFDLAGLAIAAQGISLQVLTLANPPKGFQLLNRLRSAGGLTTTPICVATLRAAVKRLRSGGMVATGVDRPTGHGEKMVQFFGRPAPLPMGYIRLALKTGAILLVGCCYYEAEMGYVINIAPPMDMIRTGDRHKDLLLNARRVIAILEGFIRDHPDQWMMFVPVWPDLPLRQRPDCVEVRQTMGGEE